MFTTSFSFVDISVFAKAPSPNGTRELTGFSPFIDFIDSIAASIAAEASVVRDKTGFSLILRLSKAN